MKKIALLFTASVLVISARAQVANSSVETWRNYSAGIPPTTLEAPDSWFGADSLVYTFAPLAGATPQKGLFKDNDAHTGSFAAKLVTRDLTGFVAPGMLVNANPQLDFANLDPTNPLAALSYEGGTSVSQRYNSLVAWVKYVPSAGDAGAISVMAVKNGIGTGGADSVIGDGTLYIAATANYTEITVPITYKDATTVPDKMIISFLSSDLSGENGTTPQDGSTMYVDDISLSMATEVKEIFVQTLFSDIYPNPASSTLNLTAKSANELSVRIFNTTGTLMSNTIFKNNTQLSLQNFASGIYFYEIKDVKDKKIQRGSFSVMK